MDCNLISIKYLLLLSTVYGSWILNGNSGAIITCNTVLIQNIDYLVTDEWGELPVSGNDDLNARDGWRYKKWIRPTTFTSDLSYYTEKRNTIANQSMTIYVDLINQDYAKEWLLKDVKLKVLDIFSTDKLNLEQKRWDSDHRLSSCKPTFELSADSSILTVVANCKKLVLERNVDSRVPVEIFNDKKHPIKSKVYKFKLLFTFVYNGATLEVESDRQYLLGFI